MTNAFEPVQPLVKQTGGLTKREFIAAMAMQGILASCDPENNPFINQVDAANQAIRCADALIEQLNKT